MSATLQSDCYVIFLETLLLGIFAIRMSKRIKNLDPMEKPKGIVLPIILLAEYIDGQVCESVGRKNADKLTPYIITITIYIFFSNTISLFGLASPTANLSVTLLLAIITWVLIQITEFKYQGTKGYFHSFLEPIPVMLPMNIIGKFSLLISLSVRLFGNIICGGIMMELIYNFCQFLSNGIAGWCGAQGGVFNFMAPILAPLLHAYFDLFAGFVQTLVFVSLTVVLIGNDVPEEIKKGIN